MEKETGISIRVLVFTIKFLLADMYECLPTIELTLFKVNRWDHFHHDFFYVFIRKFLRH